MSDDRPRLTAVGPPPAGSIARNDIPVSLPRCPLDVWAVGAAMAARGFNSRHDLDDHRWRWDAYGVERPAGPRLVIGWAVVSAHWTPDVAGARGRWWAHLVVAGEGSAFAEHPRHLADAVFPGERWHLDPVDLPVGPRAVVVVGPLEP